MAWLRGVHVELRVQVQVQVRFTFAGRGPGPVGMEVGTWLSQIRPGMLVRVRGVRPSQSQAQNPNGPGVDVVAGNGRAVELGRIDIALNGGSGVVAVASREMIVEWEGRGRGTGERGATSRRAAGRDGDMNVGAE
ncbi:hypothetical protein JCM24511_04166 [Saitozyma sp. JCM 24511]|nr:hypothetical protein JCM24511_04166 [Saitozyma sp. JCM 24511]